MGSGDKGAQGCCYCTYLLFTFSAIALQSESQSAGGLCEVVGHFVITTDTQGIAIPPLNNPSHHILTCSLSRHLALQSLSTLSTIDTFFGHQDSITSVSAIKPTAAATAGSRDRTCRWWKVEEEVQLVLRGGGRSFWMGEKAEEAGQGGEREKGKVNGAEEGEGPIVENQEQEKEQEKERVVPGAEEEKPKRRIRRGGKEYVEGSIDVVCVLDDQRVISGGDSGYVFSSPYTTIPSPVKPARGSIRNPSSWWLLATKCGKDAS